MAKRKYRVTWNEVYCCQSVVEADSEERAKELALQFDPDQKEYGNSEDVCVEPADDEDD